MAVVVQVGPPCEGTRFLKMNQSDPDPTPTCSCVYLQEEAALKALLVEYKRSLEGAQRPSPATIL